MVVVCSPSNQGPNVCGRYQGDRGTCILTTRKKDANSSGLCQGLGVLWRDRKNASSGHIFGFRVGVTAATAVHDDHMTKRGKNTHITSRNTPEDMCKTQAGPTIAIRPCLGGWVVGFDEGDKRGATESKLFEKLKKKIEPWPWAQNKPYGCYVVCCVL